MIWLNSIAARVRLYIRSMYLSLYYRSISCDQLPKYATYIHKQTSVVQCTVIVHLSNPKAGFFLLNIKKCNPGNKLSRRQIHRHTYINMWTWTHIRTYYQTPKLFGYAICSNFQLNGIKIVLKYRTSYQSHGLHWK